MSQQAEIENYLHSIDESSPKEDLPDELYLKADEFIKSTYLNGIKQSIHDNNYFATFSPKQKTNLIADIFE